ncbi:uncharacterized protein LOC127750437 [Frankliniella occidentalis]|uniref:Uncharacterized protein LOC127750437 n=1 Tax=Frankliniella occidentalis TaxID=133901 RepID=A0A9C6XR44_FRAOC|nr:uncharacterized protein LOC127750437 [Frankliniella occidentalis]
MAPIVFENMVEVEIEEWRMTCEICMKTPGVFNYLDFCDVCGVPVHTEENSCAVPVTPDDSDIWLCLKCKRAGEVFVVPTVDERANITVRSSKRGSDHSNDVALEEVLKELHQNTGRPVRQINMPKRLRTSYEFN